MHRRCWCVLIVGLRLQAQTSDDSAAATALISTLRMTLVNAGAPGAVWSQRLANTVMELAVKDPASRLRQPTQAEVLDFTQSLTGVLSSKPVDSAEVAVLARCVVDVLRSTGVANYALGARV